MGTNLGGKVMDAGFGLNKDGHGFRGTSLKMQHLAASKDILGQARDHKVTVGLKAEEHRAQFNMFNKNKKYEYMKLG